MLRLGFATAAVHVEGGMSEPGGRGAVVTPGCRHPEYAWFELRPVGSAGAALAIGVASITLA